VQAAELDALAGEVGARGAAGQVVADPAHQRRPAAEPDHARAALAAIPPVTSRRPQRVVLDVRLGQTLDAEHVVEHRDADADDLGHRPPPRPGLLPAGAR
jgi:hypothetical protein